MVFRTTPGSDFDYPPPSRTIFTIVASGHGRHWSATHPEGFWRDFVEINLNDASAVPQFVRRRGDPDGFLDAGAGTTNTGSWNNLAALLGTAARAYEPEGADGISRFTTDPQRIKQAEWFLRDADIGLLKAIEPVVDPSGRPRVVLRAKTLATFMALSAANAVEQRTPMRCCAHCGSWFFLGRSDAQFCSGSCRAASFNSSKGAAHGKHPKENQSERPDNLAKPVARAGTKRKGPAANKELHERKGRKSARGKGRTGDRAPRRR
jgi:hypothetical protein